MMTQLDQAGRRAEWYYHLLWLRNQAEEMVFYICTYLFDSYGKHNKVFESEAAWFIYLQNVLAPVLHAPSPTQGDMIKEPSPAHMVGGGVPSTEEPQKHDPWRSHGRSRTAVFAFLLREGQILLRSNIITRSRREEEKVPTVLQPFGLWTNGSREDISVILSCKTYYL